MTGIAWMKGRSYAEVPTWVLVDPRLSDGARVTLAYVIGRIFVVSFELSYVEIAKHRRLSTRAVKAHVQQIVRAGYLVARRPKGIGESCEYVRGPALEEPQEAAINAVLASDRAEKRDGNSTGKRAGKGGGARTSSWKKKPRVGTQVPAAGGDSGGTQVPATEAPECRLHGHSGAGSVGTQLPRSEDPDHPKENEEQTTRAREGTTTVVASIEAGSIGAAPTGPAGPLKLEVQAPTAATDAMRDDLRAACRRARIVAPSGKTLDAAELAEAARMIREHATDDDPEIELRRAVLDAYAVDVRKAKAAGKMKGSASSRNLLGQLARLLEDVLSARHAARRAVAMREARETRAARGVRDVEPVGQAALAADPQVQATIDAYTRRSAALAEGA